VSVTLRRRDFSAAIRLYLDRQTDLLDAAYILPVLRGVGGTPDIYQIERLNVRPFDIRRRRPSSSSLLPIGEFVELHFDQR